MKVTYNPGDLGAARELTAKKLDELLRERRALDQQIISLKQTLRFLDKYFEAERDTKLDKFRLDPTPLPAALAGLRELGLTDAVRKIIEYAIEPVNPRQIRDKLLSLDYSKLPKMNPLAAIHAIITRLQKNGEIREGKGDDGKPAYEWISQISDLVESMAVERGIGFTPMDDVAEFKSEARDKKSSRKRD